MNLALFDLDNTLLSGDSDFEWAQFLISKGVVDREIQEAKNIEFYEQYKAGTLDIVRQHLDNGDLCAIVTATNTFVTGAIARAFGIPHLIGTIPAVDVQSGAFTGAPSGVPAFREGKIVRVEAWLESLGLWWGSFEDSFFYSDSHNDLPLMGKVKTPVAVDADEKLQAHADAHDWISISLRNA